MTFSKRPAGTTWPVRPLDVDQRFWKPFSLGAHKKASKTVSWLDVCIQRRCFSSREVVFREINQIAVRLTVASVTPDTKQQKGSSPATI